MCRSETVGRPLAAMLANDGATVFSIDITGIQIYQRHSPSSEGICIRNTNTPPEVYYGLSDIIISAVPSDTFKIPTGMIKQGAICINIAGQNNFQEDVKTRAGDFALRVGAVTTLMLQVNALVLHSRRDRLECEEQKAC
jgi:methylenetetrahydrofolate dehydrogenase (NAD+)